MFDPKRALVLFLRPTSHLRATIIAATAALPGAAWGQPSLTNSEAIARQSLCAPSPLTAHAIREMVVQSARRYGFDETFALAIAWVESRFGEALNSSKGARGPMQLMPATAVRFAVTDICDAAQNIDAGIRYLRLLEDEFHNPLLVAAAYNCGEGRVRDYRGIPPFQETVTYVASVINHQIELSSKVAHAPEDRSPAPGNATAPEVGIVRTDEKRTFIGGVMHF